MDSKDLLIWVDIETSGLNEDKDVIFQVGLLATDANLNVISTGPQVTILQTDLPPMHEVVVEMHTASGLLDRVKSSSTYLADAEEILLAYVKSFEVEPETIPMCGSSIHFDRRFLSKDMPEFEAWFFRRNVDVGSFKEMVRRWYPDEYQAVHELLAPRKTHIPHDDLMDSIEELRAYRRLLVNMTPKAAA